jgi:hypothetical protein
MSNKKKRKNVAGAVKNVAGADLRSSFGMQRSQSLSCNFTIASAPYEYVELTTELFVKAKLETWSER